MGDLNSLKSSTFSHVKDSKWFLDLDGTIPYIDDCESENDETSTNKCINYKKDNTPEISTETEGILDTCKIKSNLAEPLHLRDKGYAWIVLGAMFVSNIFTAGYVKAFGILANAVMDSFPDASGTMIGLLVGLLSGCRNVLSPLAGLLSNRIGPRKSIFIGVVVCSTALIISAFCTSAAQLAITLGVMTGFGHCLVEVCQVVVVSQYFSKKLSFANGIRVSSLPFGGMVYPLLLTVLIQNYGLRLTFIILAGVTCHIFICALLIRPIEVHVKIKAIEKVSKIVYDNIYQLENFESVPLQKKKTNERDLIQNSKQDGALYFKPSAEPEIQFSKGQLNFSKSYEDNKKMQLYKTILDQNNYITQEKPKKKIEFKFFKNIHYLPFIFLGAGIPMACPLALYYLVLYASNVLELSPYEITILLAFQALFDFILRIFLGWLNNRNLYNISNGFTVCLWIAAFGVALMPLGNGLISLMFMTSLYSFGPAAYQANLNVVLCAKFGKEHVSSTWGFVRMMHGAFSFIHSVIIGYLIDFTGSYTIPFLLMAFGLFLCGVSMGMDTLLTRCHFRKDENSS